MFNARYFAPRQFAPRYFPKVGDEPSVVGGGICGTPFIRPRIDGTPFIEPSIDGTPFIEAC
jgi:hypothetical protein